MPTLKQDIRIRPASLDSRLQVAGLFAGIGGIELGLRRAGCEATSLCEIDQAARTVLHHRFPGIPLVDDVRRMRTIGDADIITAGFPCQDLSQAGLTIGIDGEQSGLVAEVFRLLKGWTRPGWVLLENVPFMLRLQRGRAMAHLVTELEELGFAWAYRIVDARAFGIPQRRRRVLILASRTHDPRPPLLGMDAHEPDGLDRKGWSRGRVACGFYWTEGNRGVGWTVDAVPTVKGGSGRGVFSPPAIWMTDGRLGTPDVRDAERLQGFDADWTESATSPRGSRWRLVGNAVNVEVSQWIGTRLSCSDRYDESTDRELLEGEPWPHAAWGMGGKAFASRVSSWPVRKRPTHLEDFLRYPLTPLSARAASGFLRRATASNLRFESGFLEALSNHINAMQGANEVAHAAETT